MKIDKNYCAIDLELNTDPDGSTPVPRIIQVGIAIGSYNDYTNGTLITKKWYLDPKESIYPFITSLTGITDNDISTLSVTHLELATELTEIVTKHDCFVNPITWGGGDSVELKREFREHNINLKLFGRRWIDCKTLYVCDLIAEGKNPAGGLTSAITRHKLKFEGTPHRADYDALNTLRLFFKMIEKRKNIEDGLKLIMK